MLDTLKALMMFLDRDSLEQLPLLLASNIGVFPTELDKQVVTLSVELCKAPKISKNTINSAYTLSYSLTNFRKLNCQG